MYQNLQFIILPLKFNIADQNKNKNKTRQRKLKWEPTPV